MLVTATLVAPGCAEHMVGPARTLDDYQRKARTTATDALSTVETTLLLADAASRGNTFGPYTSVSLSEQEDRLDEIAGDFGSIQPPDERADELRGELGDILGTALDNVAAVRIAARRGDLDGLRDVASPLDHDADALDSFIEEHS